LLLLLLEYLLDFAFVFAAEVEVFGHLVEAALLVLGATLAFLVAFAFAFAVVTVLALLLADGSGASGEGRASEGSTEAEQKGEAEELLFHDMGK
jgi:hypothetical protein